jgi:uncharacterized membrane protein YhaH (DUF805 family)
MKRLLSYFSFRGRANRARYWLTVLSIVGVFIATGLVASILTHIPLLGILGAIVLLVVIPAALVVSLANTARRLHDRGKSAWWVLVFQGVPFLLSLLQELLTVGSGSGAVGPAALLTLIALPFWIWALVELGILKGTDGPNKYGEDPLGKPLEEALA